MDLMTRHALRAELDIAFCDELDFEEQQSNTNRVRVLQYLIRDRERGYVSFMCW